MGTCNQTGNEAGLLLLEGFKTSSQLEPVWKAELLKHNQIIFLETFLDLSLETWLYF